MSTTEAVAPTTIAAPERTTRRDPVLDLVKVVGLVGIAIAHTAPPPWLYQARNFGVPTMAFVAGAVATASRRRRSVPIADHLRRRAVQLVVPVWAFLAVAFPALFGLALVEGEGAAYPAHLVARTFLFRNSAPFNLWVIRVFLLCALAAPVWSWLWARLPLVRSRLLALAAIWTAYELVAIGWDLADVRRSWAVFAVQEVGLYAVGFGIFYGLGTLYWQLPRRVLLTIAASLLAGLFAFYAVTGEIVATHHWKYPPQFPYLAYAGACGLGMLVLFNASTWARSLGESAVVRAAATSSLWCFLWHGFWIEVWDIAIGPREFAVTLPTNIALVALSMVIQHHAVKAVLRQPIDVPTRWWVRTIFTVR